MSEETPQITDKRRFTEDGQMRDVEHAIREASGFPGIVPSTFSPSSDPNKPIGMDLGTALKQVNQGRRVTRLEWGNPEIYLLMFMWGDINPDVPSGKYLSIHNAAGHVHPLYLNDGDMLADDWVVVV